MSVAMQKVVDLAQETDWMAALPPGMGAGAVQLEPSKIAVSSAPAATQRLALAQEIWLAPALTLEVRPEVGPAAQVPPRSSAVAPVWLTAAQKLVVGQDTAVVMPVTEPCG
jgi:hypothetical protein